MQQQKRSIFINGRKTSVSVEDSFWRALRDISKATNVTMNAIVAEIDRTRRPGNLSSAIRVWVMEHFRSRISAV